MTFTEVDISPSNGAIVYVVIRDVDHHFPGQTFSYSSFVIKYLTGSGCPRQICLDSHCPRRGVALLIFKCSYNACYCLGAYTAFCLLSF